MFGVHGPGAGLPRPAARQCDGRKQVRAAGGHDHADQRCDGVVVARVTGADGRYLFDFVDPGTYTITAELAGFKKREQRNVRVQQRGDVTADLTLSVGGSKRRSRSKPRPSRCSSIPAVPTSRWSGSSSINFRSPGGIRTTWPAWTPITATLSNENRPYHHAYANDYDAGGGTRRANDVLLDGVPLGPSYKTAYTPAVDAVEEITVSKNSVDAENGHSLGGVISLNMKSGTNDFHGSSYYYTRDPSMNSRSDPTIKVTPGQDTRLLRGTELTCTAPRSAVLSGEQDLQLHVVRAVGRHGAPLIVCMVPKH